MKRTASRNVLGWLEQQAEFGALADRAERLLALQSDLCACAPSHSLVAMGITNEALLVGTANASTAAKLRQLEPSIVGALRDRGWQIKRIRFRPQPPGANASKPAAAIKPPIPPSALGGLADLREEVSNPALKEALTNLLRGHSGNGR
ncbi:MAG: hypothetical protein KJZ83_20040 [Burkholderiaceae bacterium]|nr:hypothetical protein [Burkholderiaceae bacterium]